MHFSGVNDKINNKIETQGNCCDSMTNFVSHEFLG